MIFQKKFLKCYFFRWIFRIFSNLALNSYKAKSTLQCCPIFVLLFVLLQKWGKAFLCLPNAPAFNLCDVTKGIVPFPRWPHPQTRLAPPPDSCLFWSLYQMWRRPNIAAVLQHKSEAQYFWQEVVNSGLNRLSWHTVSRIIHHTAPLRIGMTHQHKIGEILDP